MYCFSEKRQVHCVILLMGKNPCKICLLPLRFRMDLAVNTKSCANSN